MRTGAAEPDRGTHTREGASGFCNRAHVHEYTIVDEGRYFTQPPPFTGTFLLRGPLAHVAYIVLVRGASVSYYLCYELLEHTECFRQTAGREIVLRSPT